MNKNHISEWDLQQYLLDELPPEEFKAIRERELCDDELQRRLNALRTSHAEIKAKYPSKEVAKLINNLRGSALPSGSKRTRTFADKLTRPPVLSFNKRVWAPAAVVCVTLSLFIPFYILSTNTPSDTLSDNSGDMYAATERVKGKDTALPELQVWRKTGNTPEMLDAEAVVSAGDIIQLWYVVPESCYGVLVSVDGRGVLTEHLSGRDAKAVPLIPGRPVSLPMAYRLDDAPHYEIFYLITAPDKFDVNDVSLSLKNTEHPITDLSLPQVKNITAFTLRKTDDRKI